jgi:hypothetical protein
MQAVFPPTQTYKPDWFAIRKYLDEDVNHKAHKWVKAREDSIMTLHKKFVEGPYPVTKTKVVFKNMHVDVLYKMILQPEVIKQWDKNHKKVHVIEQLNPNEDIIYVEANVPAPLANRDMIQYRCYFNNKSDPDLVRKYNFYEKDNKYYACYFRTIDRHDIPEVKDVVRAEIKLSGWILEEDPANPRDTIVHLVNLSDPKGSIPPFLVNLVTAQFAGKFISSIYDNYRKCKDIIEGILH